MYAKIAFGSGIPMPGPLTKILLVMKLTMLLLLVSVFTVWGKGKAQQVTLSGKNLSLQQVFSAVEKQTGYVTMANEGIFTGSRAVSLDVAQMPLHTLLDLVLKGQRIRYNIQGKTIFLSHTTTAEPDAPEAPVLIYVNGRVLDSTGSPLEGASVQIKGRSGGVATDKTGFFSIAAQEGDLIVITYIGFHKKEYLVDGMPGEKTFILRAVQTGIGEVAIVSTGYQQLPKERATGSFTYINREMINRSPGPDILSRLEGITNGLLFNRTSAEERT